MPSDARKLSDWLQRQSGALHEALARSQTFVQVNLDFRAWLQAPWADAVRIASLEGDTAVIFAENASVSTLLRYRSPEIIAWIRAHHLPSCTRLQIGVRPGTCTGH